MMDLIQIVAPLSRQDRNIELSMSESDVLSIFIPSFSTTGECRVQFGFYNCCRCPPKAKGRRPTFLQQKYSPWHCLQVHAPFAD